MRLQLNPIRFILTALMTFTIAASAQAQTNSPQKSRYRFVPTAKKQVVKQPAVRLPVVAVIPAQDQSTAPSQLVPMIERSNYQTVEQTAPVFENFNQPQPSKAIPAAPVHGPAYAVVSVAQSQPIAPQETFPPQGAYFPPAPEVTSEVPFEVSPAMPCETSSDSCYGSSSADDYFEGEFVMNRNFFGIDRHDICDEWAGFIGCCGLKANPGHYGQGFIVGCDPCEPNCGRCSKCLIEKICKKKCKSGKCHGCKSCGASCDGECGGECTGGCGGRYSGGCRDCLQGAKANEAASERRYRDAARNQYQFIDPRTGRLHGDQWTR